MARRFAYAAVILLFALGLGGTWPGEEVTFFGGPPGKKAAEDLYAEVAGLVLARSGVPPKKEDFLSGSLDGMLHGLDPHSNYYPPDVFKDLMEDQEGKFSGLGARVERLA